ncbi:MAG: hypothetical protein SGILL_004246 [Bacillariaceae sp.]
MKFFSPSPKCQDCIGLAEELQIVRLVLERGYVAIAVTGVDQKSGCWGDHPDVDRVQHVLTEFTTTACPDAFHKDTSPVVYAIGASSGGAMAARLLANGVVEGASVMVMSLSQKLQEKVAHVLSDASTKKSLYLAPMIRDKGTAKKVRQNHEYFLFQQKRLHAKKSLNVVLDETSCEPLPVTTDYLWKRVSGMTKEAASIIVDTLLNDAKHLDPTTRMLTVDPTRSNWRDFVLRKNVDEHGKQYIPKSLSQVKELKSKSVGLKQGNADMLLWDAFDLTPGRSTIAKALHRAWAFHEYCSESVPMALDLFEQGTAGV